MRVSMLAGLLAAGYAHAFSDSSPFLLFSTSEFPSEYRNPSQLQTAARVVSTATTILGRCPTTKYLLVAQPNIHVTDLYGPPHCEAHRLRRALEKDDVRGRYTVAEVVTAGGIEANNMTFAYFANQIVASCLAQGVQDVNVKELPLPALPAAQSCAERVEAMGDNDYVLGNVLDDDFALGDYTVVYFAGSGAADTHSGKYEAEFADPAQAQAHIKKRLANHYELPAAAAKRQAPARDTRPLFEKYQFFTPGIFMGLIVFFILLFILYGGLSAVASLQVSYGAFDKEMGPAAQKKQQ
ncbi:hypothetical protein SPI_06171 [Niveomyces insectorum RCEF 264]|uniref:Protein BIG1 n=1 Tax=Niveomyces insectorum RCEF 264 TaxID=1081102 RepID=A0A167RV70_9HYPO|nr:hypothetical protein SPI_06171 [Niveomyces insectorum RCEF 264]